jgi:tripartite-type tricarboxylate transporter receptor subunit TctC
MRQHGGISVIIFVAPGHLSYARKLTRQIKEEIMASSMHFSVRCRWQKKALHVFALAVGCVVVSAVWAEYPARPMRLVVPSAPGGGTDLTWRMIAPKLSDLLGQRIVVDNRGGAGGDIGAAIVAQANADGYTLLGGVSSLTINPAFKKNMPYNVLRDLAPVSLATKSPNFLLSNPAVPAKTVRELVAYIKAQPQPLQFASAGVGSMPHLMMELFLDMTVIGGQIPFMTGNILPVLPHVRAGRLRAYAVTSATRSAVVPEIPTLAEAGVPGYEAVQWFGMWAPAGTPREIVAKVHRALAQVLNDPEVKGRMTASGADVSPSQSPQAFGGFIRAEMEKWAAVIKSAKIEMK